MPACYSAAPVLLLLIGLSILLLDLDRIVTLLVDRPLSVRRRRVALVVVIKIVRVRQQVALRLDSLLLLPLLLGYRLFWRIFNEY